MTRAGFGDEDQDDHLIGTSGDDNASTIVKKTSRDGWGMYSFANDCGSSFC